MQIVQSNIRSIRIYIYSIKKKMDSWKMDMS